MLDPPLVRFALLAVLACLSRRASVSRLAARNPQSAEVSLRVRL
jgi:hypothetical protein